VVEQSPSEVQVLRQQVIQVVFDREHFRLSLTPNQVMVQPGDVVIWQFVQLPAGWAPWIRFDPASTPSPYSGPLTSLSQNASSIWGMVSPAVAADPAQVFIYRPVVHCHLGTSSEDGFATIYGANASVTVQTASQAALATNTLIQVSPGMGRELRVSPELVTIRHGETVTWEFAPEILGSEQGCLQPRVQFLQYHGDGDPGQLEIGPFTTLTYVDNLITGSGSAQIPGVYSYQVMTLREVTGEIVWMSSSDPVIDDRGDPPGEG
jgi:plastocyanin